MGTDAAILLLLADLQRQTEQLRARVAELEEQLLASAPAEGDAL